ncbi:hypothetical protein [Falsiroseomonas tokyonensis]|uniref:Uncharacterized protein n=1 Tax=Falsiroseomonas tokyonensis TaxID=430521 RepID=A0ABV7C556_9PROT|nr:hypothetical protein [Falsiroseomonas tokyonensis]MBU8541431.1 hypothetical protein [Falsiroseomonas tokyonensis]
MSGNPTLPDSLGRFALDLVVAARRESARLAAPIRSSGGVAVFVPRADDPAHWVEAGRACRRWGTGGRRPSRALIGQGPALPPSLRRPVRQVLA